MDAPQLPTPPIASTLGFTLILGLCVGAAVLAVRHVSRRRPRAPWHALLAAGTWLAITGGYVASGLPGSGPPGLLGFFVLSIGGALALALSPLGGRLAHGLPMIALIGFQAFRLPLELVLHAWADAGTVPPQMTWTGHNLDVLTGLAAASLLLWAGLGRRIPRTVVIAFNLLGSALLLAVMVIVVLSSPIPIKAYPGDPIILALHLPYGWILPVCVGGALCGHVLLWRALARRE